MIDHQSLYSLQVIDLSTRFTASLNHFTSKTDKIPNRHFFEFLSAAFLFFKKAFIVPSFCV